MLYIFDEIDRTGDQFWERAAPLLSAQRREKAAGLRFPADQNLSAAAYLLLRLALRENYGVTAPAVFDFGPNGKPFLRGHPGIHFNLSHCRAAAACVVSGCETGVDVQHIRPISDALARRVLTPEEYGAFKAARDPAGLFCEMWTAKESFLKKTGQGIGTDLTALSAEEIREKTFFGEHPGYRGCVAGRFSGTRTVRTEEMLA